MTRNGMAEMNVGQRVVVTSEVQREPVGPAARAASWLAVEALWLAPLLVVAVFLALYNLEYYPRTWFDEGSHLHVPKSLVLFGEYADYSAEGFRYDGPTFGVGPTVLAPIALVFQVAGIGLLQARTVMAAYLLLALALHYLVARRLFGWQVAVLSSLLLLGASGVGFLEYGRQVLGEVPAYAFFLAGVLAWPSRPGTLPVGRLLASGLFFGLAAVTKMHYLLLLPAVLVVLGVVDGWWSRRARIVHYLLPLVGAVFVPAAWLFFQLAYIGPDGFLASIERVRSSSSGAVLVLAPERLLSAVRFVLSPEALYGWVVPALAYGGLRAVDRREPRGAERTMLVAFVAVWLGWFWLASIGWPRYAFPALAVSTMLVARLLADLVSALRAGPTGEGAGPGLLRAGLPLAVAVMVGVMTVAPLVDAARPVLGQPDRSPQRFAAVLNGRVPIGSVIHTWEPELGFLTDHAYQYPPTSLLDTAVKEMWFGGSGGAVAYIPEARPEYLAVGRFGKWTGIYGPLLASGGYELVASEGEYDLYRGGAEKAIR